MSLVNAGKIVGLALVALSLTSCAAMQERAAAQRAALMEAQDNYKKTIPTCHSDEECKRKWSAARVWVINNAGMKLQHVTDDYMETYGAGKTMKLAVRVTKEYLTDGSDGQKILVNVWCGNAFGCSTAPIVAAANFNKTVNAAWTEKPLEKAAAK